MSLLATPGLLLPLTPEHLFHIIDSPHSAPTPMLDASAPPVRPFNIYRQFFTRDERRMLDSTDPSQALNEIFLIRVLLMRLMAAAQRKRRLSLPQHISLLGSVATTGHVMASLVRFYCRHHLFDPLLGDPLAALAAAGLDDL